MHLFEILYRELKPTMFPYYSADDFKAARLKIQDYDSTTLSSELIIIDLLADQLKAGKVHIMQAIEKLEIHEDYSSENQIALIQFWLSVYRYYLPTLDKPEHYIPLCIEQVQNKTQAIAFTLFLVGKHIPTEIIAESFVKVLFICTDKTLIAQLAETRQVNENLLIEKLQVMRFKKMDSTTALNENESISMLAIENFETLYALYGNNYLEAMLPNNINLLCNTLDSQTLISLFQNHPTLGWVIVASTPERTFSIEDRKNILDEIIKNRLTVFLQDIPYIRHILEIDYTTSDYFELEKYKEPLLDLLVGFLKSKHLKDNETIKTLSSSPLLRHRVTLEIENSYATFKNKAKAFLLSPTTDSLNHLSSLMGNEQSFIRNYATIFLKSYSCNLPQNHLALAQLILDEWLDTEAPSLNLETLLIKLSTLNREIIPEQLFHKHLIRCITPRHINKLQQNYTINCRILIDGKPLVIHAIEKKNVDLCRIVFEELDKKTLDNLIHAIKCQRAKTLPIEILLQFPDAFKQFLNLYTTSYLLDSILSVYELLPEIKRNRKNLTIFLEALDLDKASLICLLKESNILHRLADSEFFWEKILISIQGVDIEAEGLYELFHYLPITRSHTNRLVNCCCTTLLIERLWRRSRPNSQKLLIERFTCDVDCLTVFIEAIPPEQLICFIFKEFSDENQNIYTTIEKSDTGRILLERIPAFKEIEIVCKQIAAHQTIKDDWKNDLVQQFISPSPDCKDIRFILMAFKHTKKMPRKFFWENDIYTIPKADIDLIDRLIFTYGDIQLPKAGNGLQANPLTSMAIRR